MSTPTVARGSMSNRDLPIGVGRASAWVESPLQLLSAVEAHTAGVLGRSTLVHPRRDSTGMPAALDSLLRRSMPDGLLFTTPTLALPSPRDVGSSCWSVGDAYSGRVQLELARGVAADSVVILDDGLATLNLLRTITASRPTPLIRPRVRPTPSRIGLGLAAWRQLRRLAMANRLTVFTACPVPPATAQAFRALGGRLISHRFDWLAEQPVTESVSEPTIVIGSAMPADGLIDAESYLAWIISIADRSELRYFPHRRESAQMLLDLAAHPNINVASHNLPVEMRLRGLQPPQKVVCLPTTAFVSLKLILGSTGVALEPRTVPEHWWTSDASAALRSHLGSTLCDNQA
ncbi:hypothetical protein LWF01_03400 [Saxibacter everestensis]|uniref:Uncharacterized protein n=1 Tax=Saxibacter everestensis TaxID=2909229 RepID=A0ABY8QX44_9MICO|nr:hypothetical protein LWF01_03400 [Brevibacteriaceae bacterium ZFBP1038]